MFLGEAMAFISPVRQVLFPKLRLLITVNFPMNVFRFDYKNSISGNDDMIDLRSIVPVANQQIIKDPIIFLWQILHKRRDSPLTIFTYSFCSTIMLRRENLRKVSILFINSTTRELRLAVFSSKMLMLNAFDDGFDHQIEYESY